MQAECTSCEHNEIFVINRDHWSTASRQIFFWHYFCFWSVHGPGAKPSKKCAWKWSMDPVQRGGPWTRGPCFVLTRQLLPSARCQRAKHLLKKPLNSIFFTSRKSNFSVQNNVVSVCCSYLNMVFPGIGNVKYPHGRIDQQQQMSKGQILRYIS